MNKEINPTEEIKAFKPNVKDTTIKQYVMQLNQLKRMFDADDYMFLTDFDVVVDKVKDKHFTTRRNYYNSIIVLFQALKEDPELIKKYVDIRDELNTKYRDSQSDKISDKQKENFASMDEINGMISEMEKEVKKRRLKTKPELTGKDLNLYTMYVVYSMLKVIPTRNDVAGMVLITPKNYPNADKQFNYLVVGRGTMYYMLNQYKTNGTYGQDKKIDVPLPLSKIIRPFLRATKKKAGDVIFTTSTGNAISRNVLSQMLLKTSKSYMGKSVSTTLMRKIVVSHELGDLKKKQADLADKMMHSVATQNEIYVKETD